MKIRKTTMQDMGAILKIYDIAREQMKKNGNSNQWRNGYPTEEIVINDINNQHSYTIERDGKICGVFVFMIGSEPTYKVIEDGAWINNEEYGVIHRIAGNRTAKGIFQACMSFCEKRADNIRIDTHRDNKIMQYLLEKNGFQKCGTIYVADGTPRIAYQKVTRINSEDLGRR